MEITIIVDDILSLGGSQSFAFNLSNYLTSNAYKVKLISLKKINSEVKIEKCEIISLNLKSNFFLIFHQEKINKLTKNSDIILNLSGQTFMYFSLLEFNNKFIFRESNQPLDRLNSMNFVKRLISRYLYTNFLKKNPNLIVQNPIASEQLKALSKNNLINHNVFFNPCFHKPPEKKQIKSNDLIFASRPTYPKGFDRFIKLLEISSNNFLYLGSYPESLKSFKNVTCLGRVNNVLEILSKSKILLLLSRYEGFPNIFHEAIIKGCKIILSKELSWILDEIPEAKNSIYLVSADNPSEIENKINEILNETYLHRQEIDLNSYMETFSLSNYWEKLKNVI